MALAYNVQKIERLLQDFYTVSKIKTVLYGSDFQMIAAAPSHESAFCAALRTVPEAYARCEACTNHALSQCRRQNDLLIYRCHAGLIEAVAPLRRHDVIVGYIMLGQILQQEDTAERLEQTAQYAAGYLGEQAAPLLAELTVRRADEIRAATKLMESCVCYILMNKLIEEKRGGLVFELSRYIDENPAADLSTAALCEKFSINRNLLYRLSNEHFGMPIASYVRNKRLQCAKQLIRQGVSVTEAAEQTGFYDYGYFGKIFKQCVGSTPSAVRKSEE